MSKVLFVIAPVNFRDEELFIPKKFLEEKGVSVDVASDTKEKAVGMLGRLAEPNVLVKDADVDEYDVIVFVGGIGVEDRKLYQKAEYLNLAKKAFMRGKVVAAICLGPKILAGAGLLRNKKAACFKSERLFLKEKGAEVSDEDIVQDGMIITASGPHVAHEFAEKIYDMISG